MKKEEIERAASAKYPHPQIVDMQAAGHQGFVEGAEWAKQEMLEKAKQFLLSNQGNLNYIDEEGNLYSDGFIVDFIKHLEE